MNEKSGKQAYSPQTPPTATEAIREIKKQIKSLNTDDLNVLIKENPELTGLATWIKEQPEHLRSDDTTSPQAKSESSDDRFLVEARARLTSYQQYLNVLSGLIGTIIVVSIVVTLWLGIVWNGSTAFVSFAVLVGVLSILATAFIYTLRHRFRDRKSNLEVKYAKIEEFLLNH